MRFSFVVRKDRLSGCEPLDRLRPRLSPLLCFKSTCVISGILASLLLGGSATAIAGNISYAYDAGGRLVCVFDNNAGNGVNYSYDPVGNITSITTATGCAQNTMRTVSKNTAIAKATTPSPAKQNASPPKITAANGGPASVAPRSARKSLRTKLAPPPAGEKPLAKSPASSFSVSSR